jgi:hypothetical protein
MSFTLKLHGVVIGRSELDHRDDTTGVAWGEFRPGPGYDLVEPVFALRAADGDEERYRKARNALALELFDDRGALVPASRLEITAAESDRKTLVLRARMHGS